MLLYSNIIKSKSVNSLPISFIYIFIFIDIFINVMSKMSRLIFQYNILHLILHTIVSFFNKLVNVIYDKILEPLEKYEDIITSSFILKHFF